MKPLVSVIMPAYNAEQWIAESIDSILNQTYENIELLIYDDGSTDGTVKIAKNCWVEVEKKSPITIVYGKINRGITYALNDLIKRSRGKYIARMDADDISHPKRIEEQVKWLERNDWVSAVGCMVELFGDEDTNKERMMWWGSEYRHGFAITSQLPYRNCICHPSVIFKSKVLKKYMYETDGAFQDYDLFLRMLSDGCKIEKVDEYLLKYRVRSDSEAAKNESNWAEIKLKINFLIKKFPRWNKFDTHVMRSIWQIITR